MLKIKLIIDTNTFIYAIERKTDILGVIKMDFPDFEPVMSRCVFEELKRLSQNSVSAKIAFSVFRKLPVIKGEGQGDDCILKTCVENNIGLLSSDKELLNRARIKNVKVLTVQDGRHIVWYR